MSDAPSNPEDETPCSERNCLIASVVLVDRRGWLLLQERDEHAPVAPDQWGLVGGHLDPGEGWEEGMARELQEETGLVLDAELRLWFDEVVQHSPKLSTHLADHWKIWAAKVDITDADVVVGEGRQICFVDPTRVTDGSLDLAMGSKLALEIFLGSTAYQELLAAG